MYIVPIPLSLGDYAYDIFEAGGFGKTARGDRGFLWNLYSRECPGTIVGPCFQESLLQ